MAEVASAFVSLMPSARGFGRATEQQVGGEMRTSGSRLGGLLSKGLMLGAGAALAGGYAALKLGTAAIGEARESQKVTAQTQAVIKSTGGAANVTAKQFGNLATAISKKVGIDDEAIQSGENLLATFTNVRNEAGKGNKIFTQATKVMVDMGVALGTDASGSAIQLGKALNDPVKGITALTRVGVSFTEQQKAQIQTLVDSGKTMSAQKIILGELNKEFGGSAAAQVTAADKAKVAWGNLEEQLGKKLLPVVDKIATFLTTKVIPAVSQFLHQMSSGKGSGGQFAQVLSNIGNVIRKVAGWIVNDFLPAWMSFANWMRQNVLPGVKEFISKAGQGIRKAFTFISKAISDNRPEIDQFVEGLKKVGHFIGTVVLPAMGDWARVYFPALGKAIGFGIRIMGQLVRATLALVIIGSRAFRLFLEAVMQTFGRILDGAAKAFGWMPGIGPKVKAANANFQALGNGAVNNLRNIENQARQMGAALDTATRDRSITITTFHNDVYGGLAGGGGHEAPGSAGPRVVPRALPGAAGKIDLTDGTIDKLGKALSGEKGRALLAARKTS